MIATQSSRQHRKEQVDLALVHAAQLFMWVTAVQGALRSAAARIPRSVLEEDPRDVFLICGDILEAAGMWSSTDLAPLSLVPGHAAAKLAGIKVRIENTKTSLKKTGTGEPFPASEIVPYCEARLDDMAREFEDLDAPRQACKKFLEKHGIEV